LHEKVPLKRLGTESEVSAAIVFLMSEAAAFISGSCLRVDGAVPNVRRPFPLPDHANSKPFNGFHLATTPKVLERD
jgi:citronellol/citronellal dehydrogenase